MASIYSTISQGAPRPLHSELKSIESYRVGVAEYMTTVYPKVLVTLLGSCIAICLHDPVKKRGGLAHVMLPYSSHFRSPTIKPGKYADTAIEALLEDMTAIGCIKSRLTAKISGGARMLKLELDNGMANIGDRNIIAAKETLEKEGIELLGEDTGEVYGRRVEFHTDSGMVSVKKVMNHNEPMKYL